MDNIEDKFTLEQEILHINNVGRESLNRLIKKQFIHQRQY